MVTTRCPSPAKVVRHTSTANASRNQWRFSSNFVDPPDVSLLQDSGSDEDATEAPYDGRGMEEGSRSSHNNSEDEVHVCSDEPGLDRHLDTSLSLADHLMTPKEDKQGKY